MSVQRMRQFREVVKTHRLAYLAASGNRGANIHIPILGLDPRVVLQVSLWVSRANDSAGSGGDQAAVSSGVTWTAYAAVFDEKQDLRPLVPLPGFEDRAIRGASAWGADGVLRSGDAAELSASGALVLAIKHADIYATLSRTRAQQLWISVNAYPSDALAEVAQREENREAYRGLLEQIQVSQPTAIPIAATVL